MLDRQPILIAYDDGVVEMPGAHTYGDALARIEIVMRVSALLKRQIDELPLQEQHGLHTGLCSSSG